MKPFRFVPFEEAYKLELWREAIVLAGVGSGTLCPIDAPFERAESDPVIAALDAVSNKLGTREYRAQRMGRANVNAIVTGRRQLEDAEEFSRWRNDLERRRAECRDDLVALRAAHHPAKRVADIREGPVDYSVEFWQCVVRHIRPPMTRQELSLQYSDYWLTIESLNEGEHDADDVEDARHRVRFFDFWARRFRLPGLPIRPHCPTLTIPVAHHYIYCVGVALDAANDLDQDLNYLVGQRPVVVPARLPASPLALPGPSLPPVDGDDLFILAIVAESPVTLTNEGIKREVDKRANRDHRYHRICERTIADRVRDLISRGLIKRRKRRGGVFILPVGREVVTSKCAAA